MTTNEETGESYPMPTEPWVASNPEDMAMVLKSIEQKNRLNPIELKVPKSAC